MLSVLLSLVSLKKIRVDKAGNLDRVLAAELG